MILFDQGNTPNAVDVYDQREAHNSKNVITEILLNLYGYMLYIYSHVGFLGGRGIFFLETKTLSLTEG